jgi:hypothetical protein
VLAGNEGADDPAIPFGQLRQPAGEIDPESCDVGDAGERITAIAVT